MFKLLFSLLALSSPLLLFGQEFVQDQKFTEKNQVKQHYFGFSSAIDGNYAIVGAKWDDLDTNYQNPWSAAGSAYIFQKKNGKWEQIQKITSKDRGGNSDVQEIFGTSVGISGNTIVVGASGNDHDENGQNQMPSAGAIYIFEKNGQAKWVQTQKIVAPDRSQTDNYGDKVSISGNYLIIGAYKDDQDAANANSKSDAGSAYIYERDNVSNLWKFKTKIVASDRLANDFFGFSVSISNAGYAVVGAYGNDTDSDGKNTLDGAGAAYLFARDQNGNWTQIQKLISPEREYSGRFGFNVNIRNTRCIVAADLETEENKTFVGSAYIFELSNNTFAFKQKLIHKDILASDGFGKSITQSDNHILIGCTGKTNTVFTNAGAIYIFENQNSSWTEMQKLKLNDPNTFDLFGSNCSISDSTIIAGVYNKDKDGTITDAGAAYLFNYVKKCSPTQSSITIKSCDDYITPSGKKTLTISNTYTDTILNKAGCDSIITIAYTKLTSTKNDLYMSSCDQYNWMNNTYTTSGVYTEKLINAAGCDSIVTLNLTIHKSIHKDTIVKGCKAVTFNNETYTKNGNYEQKFTTKNGCDSIIHVTATIITIDTTLQHSNQSLSVKEENASYQWKNCSNNTNIISETNKLFTPTKQGSYYVTITKENCKDSSNCHSIQLAKIENTNQLHFTAYPNPFTSEIKFSFNSNASVHQLKMIDINGKLIVEFKNIKTNEFSWDGTNSAGLKQPIGTYFIIYNNDLHEEQVFKIELTK